jgi:SAM-dependent methyltransferase
MPRWLYRQNHRVQLEQDTWVMQRATEVAAGCRVLDVGAGGAPYRGLFSHCEYETQDLGQLDPVLLTQGEFSAIDYVSDAADIDVPDGSIDVVLCTEVLEHVPEPIAVLHEIGRILKPGGRLFLTVPLGSGLHQEPYHFYGGYTPHFFDRFLREAGFERWHVEAKGGSFGHYAMFTLWFAKASNPFSKRALEMPNLLKVLLFLIYIASLPLAALGFSYARFLERFETTRQFAGGYYVVAWKA